MIRNIANEFQEEVYKIYQDGVNQIKELINYVSKTGFNPIPILKEIQEIRFIELLDKTKTNIRYQI